MSAPRRALTLPRTLLFTALTVGALLGAAELLARTLAAPDALAPRSPTHPDISPSNLGLLTDGQVSQAVTFTLRDDTLACDNYTWLWYDLGVAQTVRKVVVKYPKNSKRYLICWKLVVSDRASPGVPREPGGSGGGSWSLARGNSAGTPNELSVDLPQGKQKARHLGLLMYENNEEPGSYEHFELTEAEAWGQPAPPSCQ